VNLFDFSSEPSCLSKGSEPWGFLASESGCFSQDVEMHHAMRTAMTPDKDAIIERATVVESWRHMNRKAVRKETMLKQM